MLIVELTAVLVRRYKYNMILTRPNKSDQLISHDHCMFLQLGLGQILRLSVCLWWI